MGIRKNLKRGFTLVELMIVVAIIGILAALAIYGVRRYVTNAKTAEARNSLGAIAKAASMSYDRESMAGETLALGDTAAKSNRFCGPAHAPVPSSDASIAGQKYQSSPNDWAPETALASHGWKCLMFSMEQPQYFQYDFTAADTAAGRDSGGDAFTVVAIGNLDGDADNSTFQLRGALQEDPTTRDLAMTVAPAILETNPDE